MSLEREVTKLRKHRETLLKTLFHHLNKANELNEGSNVHIIVERLKALKTTTDDYHRTSLLLDEKDNHSHELIEEDLTWSDRCIEVRAHLEALHAKLKPAQTPPREISKEDEIKLPPVDIKPFDGSPGAWLPFRDVFKALVHDKPHLSKVKKMHYLKCFVTGNAAECINHLQVIEANYDIAWNRLEERFHNHRILVDAAIHRLMSQPTVPSKNAKAIRTLIDTTNEALHMIGALGGDTNNWDPIVIHIVMQKLDSYTQQLWKEKLKATKDLVPFEQLLEFLETRAQVLEETVPWGGPSATSQVNSKINVNSHKPQTKYSPKANATKPYACPFCDAHHRSFECELYLKKDLHGRMALIQEKKVCSNCLFSGHETEKCRANYACQKCGQKHHLSIHDYFSGNSAQIHSTSVQRFNNVLLATAVVPVYSENGERILLRALIDQGSQVNLISEAACQRLRLKKIKTNIPLIGIGETNVGRLKSYVKSWLSSTTDETYQLPFTALVLSKITQVQSVDRATTCKWEHLSGLQLADAAYDSTGKIDLLLGAEVHADIILAGLIKGEKGSPIAQQTKLGWILSGSIGDTKLNPNIHCLQIAGTQISTHGLFVAADQSTSILNYEAEMMTATTPIDGRKALTVNITEAMESSANISDALKRFWEIEQIPQRRIVTADERACEEHFLQTVTKNEEGRYVVCLPFIYDETSIELLGDSRKMAVRRLLALEQRLEKNHKLKQDYHEVMQNYIDMGHMKEVSYSNLTVPICYYLPHHAVFKETSTSTKTRVVYDASAKTTNGQSLNMRLHKGATLQEDLFSIMIRWRTHPIVYTADIEKMYRQFQLHPNHWKFQRVLWRFNRDESIRTFELTTVTFGVTSAPFQAIRSLMLLADENVIEFPRASALIKNDTYVDDITSGTSSLTEAIEAKNELIALLNRAKLPIRKWTSNCQEFLETIPLEDREINNLLELSTDDSLKALGIWWSPLSDEFQFKVKMSSAEVQTKRVVLTEIAKLYDPFGWLSPVIAKAKILLQLVHISGPEWDAPIQAEYRERWLQWMNELPLIERLRIPRWLGTQQMNAGHRYELHGFCDSSERAYAAVAYVRVISDMDIKLFMIASKGRVAPLKKISLPKLELLAAGLLAELLKKLETALKIELGNVFAWTDSTIVLAWLKQHPSKWHTFVANRVSEIQEQVSFEKWRHVPTKLNPADCASRGMMPSELIDFSLWWAGPDFLKQSVSQWPKMKTQEELSTRQEERNITIFHTTTEQDTNPILHRFEKLYMLNTITALCYRFKSKCKGMVNSVEYNNAHRLWVKHTQQWFFPSEIRALEKERELHRKSKLLPLNPFLDEYGIIRVGGRLENAQGFVGMKHPMLLPPDAYLTKLIILEAHERNLHGGAQTTLNYVRQRHWIIHGRKIVRSVINKCMKCARWRAVPKDQIMAPLPAARVTQSHPFLHTGVDYAGPFEIKSTSIRKGATQKCYFCLLVCFCTKAIHLELVSDMSTAKFLAAFRRFVSRRGLPMKMYSDRGSNFVGAAKELVNMFNRYSKENAYIQQELKREQVEWVFNPASAPHFGGLWEAGVKSVKTHLKRMMGDQRLSYEQLETMLIQIEGILNSRPMCALTEDVNDLSALTPGHFLIQRPLTMVPDQGLLGEKVGRLDHWQHVQYMVEQFWQRWHKEYLQTLQQRSKWRQRQPNACVGELVLVIDDRFPPAKWQLGRITSVQPDRNDQVRKVKVKTSTGIYDRPIHKLASLPLN